MRSLSVCKRQRYPHTRELVADTHPDGRRRQLGVPAFHVPAPALGRGRDREVVTLPFLWHTNIVQCRSDVQWTVTDQSTCSPQHVTGTRTHGMFVRLRMVLAV